MGSIFESLMALNYHHLKLMLENGKEELDE